MEMIEKRGRKPKYTFGDLDEIGKSKQFVPGVGAEPLRTSSILSAAKRYCKENKLRWKFRCFSEGGTVTITRVR